MRIVVVGTPGAGKTTLAKTLAATLGVPHIELDSLHWDPGWQALSIANPAEFLQRVAAATAADAWVADGNYGMVRDIIWPRATHLIWLDYNRPVIMGRVIRRSVARALFRTPLWSGNVEQWRNLVHPSHPIRWAWRTWRRHRTETEALLREAPHAHLIVHRLRRPAEADAVAQELARAAAARTQ